MIASAIWDEPSSVTVAYAIIYISCDYQTIAAQPSPKQMMPERLPCDPIARRPTIGFSSPRARPRHPVPRLAPQLLTPPRAITHILGPNCRGGCR